MELKKLAEYISIEVPTALENCYEAAMEQYRPNWLADYDFEYILDYYGFSEEYYKPRFRQEVALLKQDATLNRICWLMHYELIDGTAPFLKFAFKIEGAPGTIDYNTLPEDTHLRRELKARLLRGDTLQIGWGYFTV